MVQQPEGQPLLALPAPEASRVLAGLALLRAPLTALGELACPCDPLDAIVRLRADTSLPIVANSALASSDGSTDSIGAAVGAVVAPALEDLTVPEARLTLTVAECDAGIRWLLLRFMASVLPDLRLAYEDVSAAMPPPAPVLSRAAVVLAAHCQETRYSCVRRVVFRRSQETER